MDEQNRQQDESGTNETPEYSFLQEVIKDEVGDPKKRRRMIQRMVGLGFLIGLAASFIFSVCKPWVEDKLAGNPGEVTIPRDEKFISAKDKDALSKSENNDKKKDNYSKSVKSLNEVAKKGKKSVVALMLSDETGSGNVSTLAGKQFSGVLIADNGRELLILGPRVEEDVQNLQVTFCDGKKYNAVEKKSDANLGLAIYAVDESQLKKSTEKSYRLAPLGSSYEAKKGDTTVLLGKLFGQGNAVGYGVLKSCSKTVNRADGIYSILSTEIAGFTGGSGVMLNRNGEVLGIICDAAGEDKNNELMHAYGISDIKETMELLSNGEDVPYVGLYATDVSKSMAKERKIPRGIYVDKVDADSPAMHAGIQSGDVITAIGGKDVESFEDYHTILMKKSDGKRLLVKGYRRGAKDKYVAVHFRVTVGSHP